MKKLAHLSLGSNVGDRDRHLRKAIAVLREHGRLLAVSSVYETEPLEFTEQAWFLNCAVVLETHETPEQLMKSLLKIEREMGRERTEKKGPRTIDIDILLFGDSILNTPQVTIPHPAMARRRFVLEPLVEIAPDARHPVLKKSTQELLKELPSGQVVRKYKSRIITNKSIWFF